MGVFSISSENPLRCALSLEEYHGGDPNPKLSAITFLNCNFAKERLTLMDEIKENFTISDELFNATDTSKRLLTSDGLFNLSGLHGGVRRGLQKEISYLTECFLCKKPVYATIESKYLNRQLKYGRIDLSKWEIVKMKIEEIADFSSPLVDALSAMKDFIVSKGNARKATLSAFLHSIDFYLEAFKKTVQTILTFSLGIKLLCIGARESGFTFLEKMHRRVNIQLNVLLVLGALLFAWKGALYVIDQDIEEMIILGAVIFMIYLFGIKGTVKMIGSIIGIYFISQVIQTQREINMANR
jgi:hypothetical protein